jgi:hypothetical protein
MALQKSTEIMGLSTKNAYYQVVSVKELGKNGAIAVVHGFTNDSKEHSFYKNEFAFAYDMSGENPIKQAYEYIKTLPEFADAVNC